MAAIKITYCHNRFCGNIKLRGLLLLGGEEEQHPSELRLLVKLTCIKL